MRRVAAWPVAALVAVCWAGRSEASGAAPVVLQSEAMAVEVETEHGRITRIADREGGIELAAPPGLAGSFRLLLVLPGGERRWVEGKDQPLSRLEQAADHLALRWDGPMADERGARHPLRVALWVRLAGRSARFGLSLSNHSRCTVAEVWYPVFGGLAGFGPGEHRAETAINIPPWDKRFTLPFGDFTAFYPGQLQMGFVDIANAGVGRGLYFGAHDRPARLKAFRFAEARQGDAADIQGCLIHFPHTGPGGAFEGASAVLQFHPGGWREGGRIYRDWFLRTFGLMSPARDWIRRQTFFQMTMFMLPEGNINYRFRDIPAWAKAARDYGVTAVQISGWQRGGHDNGYPYYEPDPRLGTWRELEAGIRACHRMGLKVYFFANIQPAMMDLAWYRRELGKYVAANRNGDPYWIAGWGMGTLASRMGHTTPLMAFLDPAFPPFRRALVGYFRKLAEIGADGVHIDKMFPAQLDFNAAAPLGPDRSPWEGALQTLAEICRVCRAVRPGFSVSNECNWDRVLTYGTSTWWAGNMSTARLVFPEVLETVGHYQPYDYIGLNNAVRLGYAVMLAPHQFNRSMRTVTWRGLSAYVREVKRIRDSLLDTVFLGEYLGRDEARFEGPQTDPTVEVAVYRNRRTGRRACILTNSGLAASTRVLLGFGGSRGTRVRVLQPFKKPVVTQLPATIALPSERIAFVVEE